MISLPFLYQYIFAIDFCLSFVTYFLPLVFQLLLNKQKQLSLHKIFVLHLVLFLIRFLRLWRILDFGTDNNESYNLLLPMLTRYILGKGALYAFLNNYFVFPFLCEIISRQQIQQWSQRHDLLSRKKDFYLCSAACINALKLIQFLEIEILLNFLEGAFPVLRKYYN